jgi:hypothetical protein
MRYLTDAATSLLQTLSSSIVYLFAAIEVTLFYSLSVLAIDACALE